MIQPEFLALLASRVKNGGQLFLATDWEEYAAHMISTIDTDASWRNIAGVGNFSTRPANRIETHFEKRGTKLGHGTWDLVYERV